MKYVIHKTTRAPSYESYSGPTWDAAKMRREWQPYYCDKEQAQKLAEQLTKFNPVGFKVSEASL